jgi:hypothetical protein
MHSLGNLEKDQLAHTKSQIQQALTQIQVLSHIPSRKRIDFLLIKQNLIQLQSSFQELVDKVTNEMNTLEDIDNQLSMSLKDFEFQMEQLELEMEQGMEGLREQTVKKMQSLDKQKEKEEREQQKLLSVFM